MGLSAVTYALAKKYTDATAHQFGGLKGAPCKVKSVQKSGGQSVITLEWKNDQGDTQTSEVYVNDGITAWVSGRSYAAGDLVVYNDILYCCTVANTDAVFNPNNWKSIGGGSAECDYYIIDALSSLPNNLTAADRRIYFCLEDGNFHLWNGIKWDIVGSGVKVRELTQAEYDALTIAEKLNGTIYFVTDAPGGGGIAALTADMTATKTVGGVNAGKQYTAGTFLEIILRDILAPVLYPTFTNPSATISATGSKLLETGSSLNTTMTISFNQGKIDPAYGTNGKRAGAATGYALNGGTSQAGNSFSITVTSAQLTYQGTVSYAEGPQPKDSAGNDYSTPLPAGSINSNTITYEFVDALWANTSSAGTMTKQALVSKSAGTKQFDLPATTAADPEQIDVPGSWTVSKIEVLNTLSGKWEDATSQFTKTTTTHDDAAGVAVSYNRYTCNLGMALGARSVRVLWS